MCLFLPRFVTWDPDLDLWVKQRELQETQRGLCTQRPQSGSGLQSAELAGLSCFTHRRWYDGGTAIWVEEITAVEPQESKALGWW